MGWMGAFRASAIVCDGRIAFDRMKKGLRKLTKAGKRNRRTDARIIAHNVRVIDEGKRLLSVQLMTDYRNAVAQQAAAASGGAVKVAENIAAAAASATDTKNASTATGGLRDAMSAGPTISSAADPAAGSH